MPTRSDRARAVRGVAVPPEPFSRRTCIRSTRDRCRAGANENRSAVTTARSAANASTNGSIVTSVARGSTKPGTLRRRRTPQAARISPAAPPVSPSASPSITNSRASRPRVAPSAERIDVSRSRRTPRASRRFATLEQAMRSSTLTAANSACSVGRMPPATESMIGVRNTPIWWFEAGYCRSRAAAIPVISRCAWSRSTPSRRRASTWKPGWLARSSCIGARSLARIGNQTSTFWNPVPAGSTPTSVTGSSPIVTTVPIADGSPPKRRCQSRSDTTATAGASGSSSAAVNRRPLAAETPSTVNRRASAFPAGKTSAGPSTPPITALPMVR